MAVLNSTLRLSLLDQVTSPVRRISGVLNDFHRRQMAFASPLRGLTGQVLAFGGAYLGATQGLKSTVGAAMDFESSFADVRKVIDGTDEQLANFRRDIIGLSKEMPITANGFAEIYAAAGQSGIANAELKEFARATAQVATAWDIPVRQTGEALAKIKTALGRDIRGTLQLADALNHVGNVSAANSPALLEYTSRVAAFAETAGFSAEQALAFGGAMIGSGFEPEVAATSFRNLTTRLAKGTKATKEQRVAFKQLGLDAVKTAKGMQKNAVETTLGVLDKISKLPEWQQISVASAMFGEEARALAPIMRNADELKRLLRETGDAARYGGSAYKEYVTRAETVGNVLQILRNKMADWFRGIGDDMLPSIKEAALGVGYVIDTLGERVSVLDRFETAMRGFSQGLGYGGIREMTEGLGDLLLGKVDGSGAADELGRLFKQAEEWGKSVRELNAAIANNPLAKMFKDIAPYGLQLVGWSIGIAALAGTIRSLAKALFFLSGASTILAALKAIGTIAGIVGGGGVPGGKPPVAGGRPGATPVAAGSAWMRTLGALGAGLTGLGVSQTLGLGSRGTPEQEADMARRLKAQVESGKAANATNATVGQSTTAGVIAQMAIDAARYARAMGTGGSTTDTLPGKTADDVGVTRIDSGSIAAMIQPSGTQDVRVTNPVPPVVNLSVVQNISGAGDPVAVGSAAASALGSEVKTAVDSAFIDAQ